MACARPSFWKVPREFREASPLPGYEATTLVYPESVEPVSGHHLLQAASHSNGPSNHWGTTPKEKAVVVSVVTLVAVPILFYHRRRQSSQKSSNLLISRMSSEPAAATTDPNVTTMTTLVADNVATTAIASAINEVSTMSTSSSQSVTSSSITSTSTMSAAANVVPAADAPSKVIDTTVTSSSKTEVMNVSKKSEVVEVITGKVEQPVASQASSEVIKVATSESVLASKTVTEVVGSTTPTVPTQSAAVEVKPDVQQATQVKVSKTTSVEAMLSQSHQNLNFKPVVPQKPIDDVQPAATPAVAEAVVPTDLNPIDTSKVTTDTTVPTPIMEVMAEPVAVVPGLAPIAEELPRVPSNSPIPPSVTNPIAPVNPIAANPVVPIAAKPAVEPPKTRPMANPVAPIAPAPVTNVPQQSVVVSKPKSIEAILASNPSNSFKPIVPQPKTIEGQQGDVKAPALVIADVRAATRVPASFGVTVDVQTTSPTICPNKSPFAPPNTPQTTPAVAPVAPQAQAVPPMPAPLSNPAQMVNPAATNVPHVTPAASVIAPQSSPANPSAAPVVAQPVNVVPQMSAPVAPMKLHPVEPMNIQPVAPKALPVVPAVPFNVNVPSNVPKMAEHHKFNGIELNNNNTYDQEWQEMTISLRRKDVKEHWGFSIHNYTPFTVSKVCTLSAASEGGLQPKDVILSVNNNSVAGHNLQNVTELVSKDSTNQLNLGIARPIQGPPTAPKPKSSPPQLTQQPIQQVPASVVPNLQQQQQPQVVQQQPQQQPQPTKLSELIKLQEEDSTMNRPISPAFGVAPLQWQTVTHVPFRSLDPHSAQDQEAAMFEEQRREEQQALKTTPYRSQAVVSPKPKVRHDHPTGSYLQMQGYGDAPTHHLVPSPVPMVGPGRVRTSSQGPQGRQQQQFGGQPEARLSSMIHEIGFDDPKVEVKLPYNTPIGLYSKANAMSELQRNSPQVSGQQGQQRPATLAPDQLIDASDLARNLASSPTWQLIQEHGQELQQMQQQMHQQQQQQHQQQQQMYQQHQQQQQQMQQQHQQQQQRMMAPPVAPMRSLSPAPSYLPSYVTDETIATSGTFSSFAGRTTPQQSHTFKMLQSSLLDHPNV